MVVSWSFDVKTLVKFWASYFKTGKKLRELEIIMKNNGLLADPACEISNCKTYTYMFAIFCRITK